MTTSSWPGAAPQGTDEPRPEPSSRTGVEKRPEFARRGVEAGPPGGLDETDVGHHPTIVGLAAVRRSRHHWVFGAELVSTWEQKEGLRAGAPVPFNGSCICERQRNRLRPRGVNRRWARSSSKPSRRQPQHELGLRGSLTTRDRHVEGFARARSRGNRRGAAGRATSGLG